MESAGSKICGSLGASGGVAEIVPVVQVTVEEEVEFEEAEEEEDMIERNANDRKKMREEDGLMLH